MKSRPASSASLASARQSSQLADQRSGTVVAERPDEQLAPNSPILSALSLYMAMRDCMDAAAGASTAVPPETNSSAIIQQVLTGQRQSLRVAAMTAGKTFGQCRYACCARLRPVYACGKGRKEPQHALGGNHARYGREIDGKQSLLAAPAARCSHLFSLLPRPHQCGLRRADHEQGSGPRCRHL